MDWDFYGNHLIPALNDGLWISILLILPSVSGGLLMGIVVGALRTFGSPLLKSIGNGYAGLFRGTPLVVQLFILYFGLPNIGIYLSPYAAAITGFILCSGAYHSEYIRGGLLSIKQGQLLAAKSLGFSSLGSIFWIILPQAMRRALHGCSNEIIYLIKYSSLAYIITCIEITGQARDVATTYFRFTESFFVAGIYYLAIVTLAGFGLGRLEKTLYIPGFGKKN
ncbi:MAG: amino acid ABC transporter permease [Desulfobacterales bacterium]